MESPSIENSTTQPGVNQSVGSENQTADNTNQSVGDAGTLVENTSEDEQITTKNMFSRRKRKRTSKLWDEFKEIVPPDGTKRVECVHCKSRLVMNKTGATTQYNRHLSICTQRKIALRGKKQITINTAANMSECVNAVENFKYVPAKLREVFDHMLIVHELSFALVEYEMFNLFMRTATPNWEKNSRATARKYCVSAYELEKKKIKTILKRVNKISITTDLWKSYQNIQYIIVTAHFVDANFSLQKCTLNFVDVPLPHTRIVICDALKKCFVQWEIESKVWIVTVDNASYNDIVVQNLKSDLRLISQVSLDGKFFHVRCCAHILNILVQYGLTEIDEIIRNVRESVKYIGKSVYRLHIFGEIANQLKLPRKKLVLVCGTRWNATYMMLSTALEFKDVFPRYKQQDESYNFLPSADDWKKADVVCSFLQEFNAVTTIISGTKYPTSNLFLPELYFIKKLLDDSWSRPDNLLKEMVRKMKEKFDKYWGDNNVLISIAVILDPRNKWKIIEFAFNGVYSPMEAFQHEQEVRSTLLDLFNEYVEIYKSKFTDKQTESENTVTSTSNLRQVVPKGQTKGRFIFNNYIRNVDCFQLTKSEVDVYLEDGVVFYNSEIDPPFDALRWWKENSNKYRILSIMACDILSIPITTVASESAFSAGGRVIDPHHASLGTDTVEFLTCGSDWFRSFYGIKRKGKDTSTKEEVVEYPLS